MKILMAAPFDSKGRYKGGINTIVTTLMTHQEENFSEQTVFPYNTCRVERTIDGSGAFNSGNLKNALSVYKDIVKEIKKQKPDVLYYHSSIKFALLKDLLIIRHAKKKTGVKTVIHIHFAEYEKIMTGKTKVDNLILSCFKKYVDKIVFLSKNTRDEFVEKGIAEEKTAVIYNFSTVEYNDDDANKKLQLKNDVPQLLFVGSIDIRKGIFEVLEVINKNNLNCNIHICGACPDQKTTEKFEYYKNILGSKIIDHGYVSGEEKKQIFLNSDVLVLASHGEGLPMVIMEAFHAGCAVLSTTVGAIPEIVKKENGILIAPGDEQALTDSLNLMLNDSNLTESFRSENLKEAKNYTVSHFYDEVIDVSKSLL